MGTSHFGRRKQPLITQDTAAGAVKNIDGQIKRLDTRFALGTLDETEFAHELRRLREQRAIYAAQATDDPKPAELEGIAAKWKGSDAAVRWELLNALFERLHVKDREIIGYTPRGDRASRVALLLSTAESYLEDDYNEDWTGPSDGDGPGAARVSRISGEGGIRTLEGALHPLPA